MPLPVYHLRRLLAATAVLFSVVVAAMYFYARLQTRDARKEVPFKLPYEIKQTANGFEFSNSKGDRTLFTVHASEVKQFKLNGIAELHNVSIILYGRDSSRYDQIYGDDFSYNQQTGDISAKGEVQIDLVSNPSGESSPDQSTPKEIKNPIHLKTRDLVFNKDSGNAWTNARVDFSTPQARGSAVGIHYAGKKNELMLSSQIHILTGVPDVAVIDAAHGVITNDPHVIVLDHPELRRESGTVTADQATFFLSAENDVQRVVATGNVQTDTKMSRKAEADSGRASGEVHGRSDNAEFLLTETHNLLRTAILTGNVHLEQMGPQPIQGDAGRVVLDYSGQNELQQVHALDGARLTQQSSGSDQSGSDKSAFEKSGTGKSGMGSSLQNFVVTAPVIDFTVLQGHLLDKAVTSGAARIEVSSVPNANPSTGGQHTTVTAGKFEAKFTVQDGSNRLASVHGAPDARIVNSNPGEPDRTSTSDMVDAALLPQGGIESITQRGNVFYSDAQPSDKQTRAWANSARYTPADQMLVLSGNPRVTNGGMETTANVIRMNRASGDAFAEGDVKSTYSDLKEQPNGALLASSSPIHVTAHTMTAHNSTAVALYTGNARLWQDANIVEAPSIQFDRDRRFVVAQGNELQPVHTILAQTAKPADQAATPPTSSGRAKAVSPGSAPIVITAKKLTYADAERKIHYEGGVIAKSDNYTATAETADAFLVPRSQSASTKTLAGPSQLDHMVAEGDVVVQEPGRKAVGQKLVYIASEDKFVLTGGPPSIFDAEQGKITGVSLTFFRTDDRVIVEGEANAPVVTQTRVAR